MQRGFRVQGLQVKGLGYPKPLTPNLGAGGHPEP